MAKTAKLSWDNHSYLLIETPEDDLPQGMQQLNGIYTQRFNQGHKHVGHVFQGRFLGLGLHYSTISKMVNENRRLKRLWRVLK